MRALIPILCATLFLVRTTTASAHCDTYDGPVVKAGQKSLETGDLDFSLIWIKPASEAELRSVFKQAVGVRLLGNEARELADRLFLETLVRLHRAGEGEPFTGIKPKGTDVGPAIPAADAAVMTGSTRALNKLIVDATNRGIQHRLESVRAKRAYGPHDVARGREYVDAYVTFMHYVESLYATAVEGATSHGEHAATH